MTLEPGKRLADRYILLERLGDGGHAEVWAATDESAGIRVALKFMHLRSCSADEALLVLRHEAQMSRRLLHPGVLRVDEPVRDGWAVFLPMEYAGGGDVAQLRGATWQHILPVLLQVARVLEHAHSRGVVHRDIKPGNILFDAVGVVRITDFGTASRTGSTAALSAGSPFFASPQQLRGEAAATADDVYGLGALAYELLTRHPPYYPEFNLQRVQIEDPPRPQPAQPTPAPLLELVHSMLARQPQARPDLQQVMQTFDALLGTALLPTLPAQEASRKRRAALWWLAAVASVAVAALLLWPYLPAQRNARDLAKGTMLESSEKWKEAAMHYQSVLARDVSLQFAQEGLTRSNRRAALDAELADYLVRREQLAVPAVRDAARRALARGNATRPQSQRLSEQLAELKAALQPAMK